VGEHREGHRGGRRVHEDDWNVGRKGEMSGTKRGGAGKGGKWGVGEGGIEVIERVGENRERGRMGGKGESGGRGRRKDKRDKVDEGEERGWSKGEEKRKKEQRLYVGRGKWGRE